MFELATDGPSVMLVGGSGTSLRAAAYAVGRAGSTATKLMRSAKWTVTPGTVVP